MYTWNRCGIVPIHQLIHWLPWALRYTPPKAAGHSGQTDCVEPKAAGLRANGLCPPKRWGSGRTGCVAPIRWGYSRPTADAHPSVNLDPTPATPRRSSFPRRRESIPVVVRHALLKCTSSPGPGRPRNPFTPSSADASAARIEARAWGLRADAGDARALVIPAEAGIHPPGTRRPNHPFTPSQRRCFSGAYRGRARTSDQTHLPTRQSEPTPATPRPSSFPRRRESIPVVVRHALLECTSSPRDPSPAQSVHPE